jgi:hypothetical protein
MRPNHSHLRESLKSERAQLLKYVDTSSSFDLCRYENLHLLLFINSNCRAACRTSSKSIHDNNKYKSDDEKYCYGTATQSVETPLSATNDVNVESTVSKMNTPMDDISNSITNSIAEQTLNAYGQNDAPPFSFGVFQSPAVYLSPQLWMQAVMCLWWIIHAL